MAVLVADVGMLGYIPPRQELGVLLVVYLQLESFFTLTAEILARSLSCGALIVLDEMGFVTVYFERFQRDC